MVSVEDDIEISHTPTERTDPSESESQMTYDLYDTIPKNTTVEPLLPY